jgi:hypothetical protein
MMDDDDECRVVGGMIGKRNRSTWTKHGPVTFCPSETYVLHEAYIYSIILN